MSDQKYKTLIGVIDQGTSSSRFIVFSAITGEIIATHQIEITRKHPKSGWMEQPADEMYQSTLECINKVAENIRSLNVPLKNIRAIGITNQRETTVAWNSETGEPLYPAIVWSDSRTAELVHEYINRTPNKDKNIFQKKTGLMIHSYFSALKIRWMLDNVKAVRKANESGILKAGTVDSWLIFKMTGGANGGKHITDVTNASRTNLFNIRESKWDPEICKFFGIDPRILPTVITSAQKYGHIRDPNCLLEGVALAGILGDQQAALVGQTWEPHPDPTSPRPHVKVTYGTGAFLLWDIGVDPAFSPHGLLTTIAYQMGPGEKMHYALEGSISYSGATMDWLRYKLNLYKDHSDGDKLAQEALVKQHGEIKPGKPEQLVTLSTVDSCYLVPAFSGLLCPHWRESARGVIIGFDEGCTRGDIIAAGYRSSAYQTQEVLQAACETDNGHKRQPPRVISVDGGLTKSPVLMQSLADITGSTIVRPNMSHLMTALGAAVAAAISVGIDPTNLLSIRKHVGEDEAKNIFKPAVSQKTRELWLRGYQKAVKRSFDWQTDAE
ncbi:hypothetical protein Aperf_G00000114422 [Anoplocephala perfoliata]